MHCITRTPDGGSQSVARPARSCFAIQLRRHISHSGPKTLAAHHPSPLSHFSPLSRLCIPTCLSPSQTTCSWTWGTTRVPTTKPTTCLRSNRKFQSIGSIRTRHSTLSTSFLTTITSTMVPAPLPSPPIAARRSTPRLKPPRKAHAVSSLKPRRLERLDHRRLSSSH